MAPNMDKKRILIVEDSATVTKVLRHLILQFGHFEALFAQTLAQAQQLCLQQADALFAAVVDLTLPDAPNGEIVELTLAHQLPTIVLTGNFDPKQRAHWQGKGVVDYITKEGRYSYELALKQLQRLGNNHEHKILVVEDSRPVRKLIVAALERQHYQIFQAEHGEQALQQLAQQPDIKLMLTDYQMPHMDGFELIQQLRRTRDPTQLCIIGLSTNSDAALSAKFIKYGANDFLLKPFLHEELYCRVNQNIELIERMEAMRDAASRDYLTGLYNRRHFFAHAEAHYQSLKQQRHKVTVAVIDLDHFKQINDRHGHLIGDQVLKAMADALTTHLGRFLIARAGGEEFFLMMAGIGSEQALRLLQPLRQRLAAEPIMTDAGPITVRFSAGVSERITDKIEQQLHQADILLYQAKQGGRDQSIGDHGAVTISSG
ncbi:diguanylate cyclase [Ferrimonas pelagia]|uniref:diguanylate cyclase n=1 Tax=Ferrimonas pelagia TaxID=1177826 RepID=A0ABP9EK05_9GAMM